jgi:hypothetical protein
MNHTLPVNSSATLAHAAAGQSAGSDLGRHDR